MSSSNQSEKKNALIVDDSRAMRSMLGRIMCDLGFNAIEAENGLEALERIRSEGVPALALVDWNMPEMDGFELLMEMRKKCELDDVPIVMVTSETEMDRVKSALSAGATEYMMKPFTKEVLIEKLRMMGVIGS